MKKRQFKLQYFIVLLLLFSISSCEKEDSIIGTLDDKISNEKSEKNGYEVNIINQVTTLDKDIVTGLINTFHEVYPKMAEKYNPNTQKSVRVIISDSYTGVAYTSAGSVTISGQWITENREDTDVLTHELMHVVQAYSGSVPTWLTEGIADYVRSEFGINNQAAGWKLPTAYKEGQNYTDGYGVAGAFLVWLEAEYDELLVKKMDENLRNGTYSLGLWVEYTGFSLPDLWLIYAGKYVAGGDIDKTNLATLQVSKENPGGADAGEGSSKLIDGNESTKFLIFDYPEDFWMQQDLPSAELVNMYTLTSGNDAPDRDAKDWILSGSNDGTTWVVLDTRTDEAFDERNQTKEYHFESTTKYKHYRIAVTANNGGAIFQISEWRLFEHNETVTDLTNQFSGYKVSKENPKGADAGEGSKKLVDGDINSKFLIFDFPDDFWMQQEFTSGQIVNRYALTSGNDAPDRDPKDWVLSGSNDETTWEVLDSQTNQSFDERKQTVNYDFKSDTAYKYYRLAITANNGGTIFQIGEWRLLRVE